MLFMDASNYSILFVSTMEEVQIIDIEKVDEKLRNEKKKSEIEEKLLCSLVNSIKALAECKTNPKSFKDEPDDEISIIDETHKLTLNRASAGIYARTVLYCTILHCTVLYSTVQSLTFPQIPCVRLC